MTELSHGWHLGNSFGADLWLCISHQKLVEAEDLIVGCLLGDELAKAGSLLGHSEPKPPREAILTRKLKLRQNVLSNELIIVDSLCHQNAALDCIDLDAVVGVFKQALDHREKKLTRMRNF